jgi:hypothetical protein
MFHSFSFSELTPLLLLLLLLIFVRPAVNAVADCAHARAHGQQLGRQLQARRVHAPDL